MSTKNVILGTAATCLAVGSAVASFLTSTPISVLIGTTPTTVYVASTPSCTGTSTCVVKVRTKNGVTIDAVATVLDEFGTAKVGSGIVALTARTQAF